MNSSIARRSPLNTLATALQAAGSNSVRMAPIGFRTLIDLRGPADDKSFFADIQRALNVELPTVPNRWIGNGDRSAIWLGPDEWLIMAPEGREREIENRIRDTRGADPWLSVVDVSHSCSGILLSGDRTMDVLAKGCPLDLHSRTFGSGDCAQSLLAKARVLLRCFDDARSVEVWVRNSFANYAALWLIDSAAEFQVNSR